MGLRVGSGEVWSGRLALDAWASAQRLTALMNGLAVQVTLAGMVNRRQLATWVREAAAAELGFDPAQVA